MVFKGTTSSTANSEPANIASDIISFTIANKGGGAAEVSIGIVYGSTITYLYFEKTINANDVSTYSGNIIRVLPNYHIFISTNVEIDYYFTIE